MSVKLSITVVDVNSAIGVGYTHIKVYRSAEQDVGFTEITTPDSIIELQSGQSTYTFIDGSGTTEHWYRTTFFDNTGTVDESNPSSSFRGDFFDTNFAPITYPEDAVFTPNDYYVIDRIRNLIGDPKELTRDYISVESGYSSISVDQKTHSLSNPRGWPLKVTLDGVEYTSKDEPRVNDYQFITFSGTIINTTSGTLDVWYYHFRHSDTEILRTFNGLTPPPQLEAEQVTFELAAVCAAIEILEKELRLFGVNSGTEVDIFQEIRINPKGGFDGRLKDLDALRKRKKDLIDAILAEEDGINSPDICGVLID